MRTEYLEYLIDLHETLSLSKTANNFFTSHQVINNGIKALEKEFNVQILNRTHRGIHFTDAGLLIYDYAQKIFAEKKFLQSKLLPYSTEIVPTQKGNLTIYIIPRYNNTFFINFYNLYCTRNKKLSVSLKNCQLDSLLDNIALDDTSIVLATMHTNYNNEDSFLKRIEKYNLGCTILKQSSLGFCISSKSKYHPLLHSPDFNIKDVPIIVFSYSADGTSFFNSYPTYHLIDNFDLQKKMIKSGKYVGMYTQLEYNLFFKADSHLEFFKRFLSDLCYIAIYNKTNPQPQVNDFIAELKAYFNSI